jgi:putative membrane protein
MESAKRDLWVLTVLWGAGLLWSGIAPYDRGTWAAEVAPAVIALPILGATIGRFPLSRLAYVLICIHGLILMGGAAYTYARVPLGFWVQDWLDLSRNPYDKLGHFAQGFIPAIVAREILIRQLALPRGRWLAFLVLCICGAISGVYEIIEWQAALWVGDGASDFLGTQGDPWDTQADMLYAFIGAGAALITLSGLHDRSMARIDQRPRDHGPA